MITLLKQFLKHYWKTLVFFAVIGVVGGFFVGIYQLDSYPQELQQQFFDQGLTKTILGMVTAVQSAGYGLVLGGLGIILAKKVGLWRDGVSFDKRPLMVTIVWAVIGGLALILPDLLFFEKSSEKNNKFKASNLKNTYFVPLRSFSYFSIIFFTI